MNSEVLVHVRAPSRVVDDKRYAAIACGVLNFIPVSRFDVISISESDNLSRTSERTPQDSPSKSHAITTSKQSQILSKSGSHLQPNELPASGKNEDLRRICGVSKRLLTPRHPLKKSINPPYKSPLRSSTRRVTSNGLEIETPAGTIPPSTARPVSETLVPNTEGRGVKRLWSDIPQDEEDEVVIVNSQPLLPADMVFPSQFFCSEAISLQTAISQEPENFTPFAQSTVFLQEPGRAYSPQNSSFNNGEFTADPARISVSPDSLPEDRTEKTIKLTKAHVHTDSIQCLISTQDTIHKTTSVQQGEGKKTAIPSKRPELNRHRQGDDQVTGGLVVQHPSTNLNLSPTIPTQYQPTFSVIQKLPVVIKAPFSNVRYQWVPAQKLPILNATAAGLAMPMDFKPEAMARAISQHERGYWRVPFAIKPNKDVRISGMKNTTEDQIKISQTWQPLLTQKVLTEDEFVHIWKDLEDFIGSGNAGWSISVIRRNFLVEHSKKPSTTQAQLHLQVYCYGEDIPYVYAMLLLCTRLHVLCSPLQWMSTLDGKPVLMMTGDSNRRGALGPWTRTRNKSGNVFWFCE